MAMSISQESLYLLHSNRKRCTELLSKPELTEEEITDALIFLHLVLEVGLNGYFRSLQFNAFGDDEEIRLKMWDDFDKINFIDKAVFFIRSSRFDLKGKGNEAQKHYSVISRMRDFSEVRNRLLHGHSVLTMHTFEGETYESKSKKMLTHDFLKKQVEKFISILNSILFFNEALDWGGSGSDPRSFAKEQYLSDAFIPKAFRSDVSG